MKKSVLILTMTTIIWFILKCCFFSLMFIISETNWINYQQTHIQVQLLIYHKYPWRPKCKINLYLWFLHVFFCWFHFIYWFVLLTIKSKFRVKSYRSTDIIALCNISWFILYCILIMLLCLLCKVYWTMYSMGIGL